MVCTGNICRSPTAEGVMRSLTARLAPSLPVQVDSAGTHGYHVGDPPDARSVAHARRRGYDLSGLRARRLEAADYARFDLILCMDHSHLASVQARAPADSTAVVQLFRAGMEPDQVPDPYYDSAAAFETVLDLVEDGCRHWIGEWRRGATPHR